MNKEILHNIKSSNLIYNKIAERYGFDINRTTTEYLKYRLISQYCSKESEVLDIGCANGLYSIPLSNVVKTICCLDINIKLLNILENRISSLGIKNIKCVEKDALDIDQFKPKKFDTIFSYSTLLLVPQVEMVLKKIPDILETEGTVILDITGKYNLSQLFWRKWYKSSGHNVLNAFNYTEISNFLACLGFNIIESHALGFCDQWKYLPIVNRFTGKLQFIDSFFHHKVGNDLDYIISNLAGVKFFANRWLIVAKKIR